MKKLTLLVLSLFILAGCSPEKEAQVQQYWAQQRQKLILRLGPAAARFLTPRTHRGTLTPEQQQELLQALKGQEGQSVNNTGKAAAKPAKPLDAMLFLSPTCPWCQRVQKEGFARKFQDKYDGQIVLTTYMLDKQENMDAYSKMVKKHKLSGGVPLLIIGNTPIQGYSEKLLEQASAVAEKEIQKHNLQKLQSAAANTPPVLQVSMEDEEITGPASAQDKKRMKRMLLSAQEANGAMIQSIGVTFGAVVKNQAMAQAAQTEKKLKEAADKSADLAAFKKEYDQIMAKHNDAMNKLMLQNKDKIRNVR